MWLRWQTHAQTYVRVKICCFNGLRVGDKNLWEDRSMLRLLILVYERLLSSVSWTRQNGENYAFTTREIELLWRSPQDAESSRQS